jgi:hypothetical protein
MGGSHWSEAQVDGNAGLKPSTSLCSVAATQSQLFKMVGIIGDFGGVYPTLPAAEEKLSKWDIFILQKLAVRAE